MNGPELEKVLKSKKMLFATWSCNIKDYYQYRDWRPYLSSLFGKFVVFSPRDNFYRHGKEKMNKMFLDAVKKEKPDFILFSFSYDEFYLETLEKIREISPKTIVLNFFGDDDWRYDDWGRYYALYVDYNLSAKKDSSSYRKDGFNYVKFFWGINPEILKPLDVEKKYDVSFIGSPVADRYEYIKYLKENGVKISLFGPGWANYPEFDDIYKGFLSSEDFVKVINQSKINLNFTKTFYDKGKAGQFKGRIFEVAACRAFQLVEASPMLVGYYENNKKVNFIDKKELKNKIDYYLDKPEERDKIAKEAYEEILENDTWAARFMSVFDEIIKNQKKMVRHYPAVKDKCAVLQKADLFDVKNLGIKISDANYVTFADNLISEDKKRKYIQIYSLIRSKKQISCCDALVGKKGLSNYLMMTVNKAFNTLRQDKFNRIVQPAQLVVKKDYFVKHLDKFRKLYGNNNLDLINESNTNFVSIPLVEINRFNQLGYGDMLIAYQIKFRDELYRLVRNKEFLSIYPYRLLGEAILGNWFIVRYLFGSIFNRDNWLRLKGKI